MDLLKPISQKQAVITISEISDVAWTAIRGGRVQREKTTYDDGKSGIIRTFTGFFSFEPVTLSKSFDPVNDQKVIDWIKGQVENPTPFNVAVQPVKADLAGTPFDGAKQLLYSNCTIGDYKLPDFDRNSTGLATIEVEVIFNELPTQQ